jgi:hypothetical protein
MNVTTLYKLTPLLFAVLCFNACKKELDLSPANSVTAAQQYSTAAGYKDALAKVYGSYSLVSSNGTGSSDINVAGISDPGETDFLRVFWNMQELTTDEDVCAWNDVNLQAFHNINWTATNLYATAMYDRSLFQITVCNEFIRQSSDALIASRGFTGTDAQNIRYYRAEARFLRAFQYWVLMDLFANPPFVTENDPISTFLPPRITRANLFTYVVSELKSVDSLMVAPRQNEYARADQAAADALLARVYLNAEVYTGTADYTDAITYAQKVINDGYALMPHYKNLFMADNNINNTEVILPIAYDGESSQNYGGTTFLVNSAHGTNVTEDTAAGIPNGGWLGNRSTQNLPQNFSDYSGNTDTRAMFGSGTLAVADELNFGDGLEVVKFTNKNSDGTTAPSPNGEIVSTDFPLFRLAEMYLVYIEAVARGGSGGSAAQALQYFNMLRERAYGNANGDVASYTLDDILNERQHELYWEGFRRTDLVRYGYFTSGSYLWPWKGGVLAGTGVSTNYNIFPIPSTDILTNTNLKQNPGY